MYESQPRSGYSSNQNSGPSQPEWRLPSNPRPQPASQAPPAAVPPPPPPPPPPSSYNPNSYGPMHGAHSVNTSSSVSPVSSLPRPDITTWGVRFNQLQAPPPLPPRPSSATDHPHNHAQSPVVSSPSSSNKPLPAPPSYSGQPPVGGYPQWTTSPPPYASQHSVSPISASSPPPQPLPPQVPPYLDQTPEQNTPTWQPSSSSAQPNNHPYLAQRPIPKPTEQGPGLADASSTHGHLAVVPPPVPPKSPHFSATASALGPGSPSDWEHLGPQPGHIDDVEVFQPKNQMAGPPASVSGPPQDHQTTTTSPAMYNQNAVSTPPQSISPLTHTSNNEYDLRPHNQSTASPVSSSEAQEPHEPPHPVRVDSLESNYSTGSTTDPSESIDGVIEAWTRPLSPGGKTLTDIGGQNSPINLKESPPKRKPSPLEIEIPKPNPGSTIPPKEVLPDGSHRTVQDTVIQAEPTAQQSKAQDPYEDMDPWFKSSLARYSAMLSKETVADSDEERFKIFTAFMAKETKLREILYGIEHETECDEVDRQPTPAPQQPVEEPEKAATPIESGLIPVESEILDDLSISAKDLEEGGYSPGGRPILPRLHTPVSQGLQRSASNPTGLANALKAARTGNSPAADPQAQFSRSTSVPPSMADGASKQAFGPLATNPPQAIYTPFRYTEGPQRGSDKLTFDRPAYQAYSDLRQASAESGRVMSEAMASDPRGRSGAATPSPAQIEHDETFLGLIRAKSITYKKRSRRKTSSPPPLPQSLRQGKPFGPIIELRTMVSAPLAKHSESSWHATIRKDLDRYSDDFSYIQSALNVWEAKAKIQREALDKERMRRQEESEKRIDDLFNDKEIGYADINVLEEEYRQTEARVQLDEERKELDDFNVNVFNPLDRRLREEISALRTHYDSALGQLDHDNGKIKDSTKEKYSLAFTMKAVNDIYQILEMRYQKRLGIALDRERRRRKTERRPLVFMGDTLALRRLDADFDRMEKRNVLEATKDRDERANRLIDSFDSAVMHGLGENQSLLDEIFLKLKRIDSIRARSSGLSDSEIEQILKSASTLVGSLGLDSETILHNFGIADSTLNDADYSVSVAEARYSHSEAQVFRRLEKEKKKEDARIQSELDTKLESVRSGPAELLGQINELLRALGKEPIQEQSESSAAAPNSHRVSTLLPGSRPPTASITPRIPDEGNEHQDRLRKALEDAKKRNASRTNLS